MCDQNSSNIKEEIFQLVRDLKNNNSINNSLGVGESPRRLDFSVEVDKRWIELSFVILTGVKGSDVMNSRKGVFLVGINENIENLKLRVLYYLRGIRKGFFTENLYGIALGELEKEGIILNFYKTGTKQDIKKIDFVIAILKDDGLIDEIFLQVKSSSLALMAEYDELLKQGIVGSFYEQTGNLQKDIKAIKEKIIEIIDNRKKGV